MYKLRLVGVGLTVATAVVVGFAAVPSRGQGGGAELRPQERQAITRAVRSLRPVGMWAVTQEFTGPLDSAEKFLAMFNREFRSQKLDEGLEGFDTQSILVLREDPTGKNSVRMSVGLSVPSRMSVREPLKVEQFRFPQAARVEHRGPYQELGRVHAATLGELRTLAPRAAAAREKEPTGFPAVMILQNDPRGISKQEIRTELIVPADGDGSVRPGRPGRVELPDRLPLRRPNLDIFLRPGRAKPLEQREQIAIRTAVRNIRPISYTLVYQTFEGTPAQMGDFLARFQKEFEGQELGDSLGERAVAPVAILNEDPEKQQSIKIDIGFPVRGRVAVRAPLATRPFNLQRTVSFTHEGSYNQLQSVFSEISVNLKTGGAPGFAAAAKPEARFPVVLRLLTDPRTVRSAEEIKTTMIVPVGS